MVDEEIQDISGWARRAPRSIVTRGASRSVIEGEIAARDADDSKSPPYRQQPKPALTLARPPKRAPRAGAFAACLAGAVAGLVVSALAIGAGYSLLTSKPTVIGLRQSIGRSRSAGAADERRVRRGGQAGERGRRQRSTSGSARSRPAPDRRTQRISTSASRRWKGERSAGANAPPPASRPSDVWRLRPRICAPTSTPRRARFRTCRPGREARIRRAEGERLPARSRALAGRIDKIEAALAAPKSETRVPAEKPAPADNAARSPLSPERRGRPARARARRLDPSSRPCNASASIAAALAPLQAVANGAPDQQRAGGLFNAVAPHVLAAASPARDAAA